MMLGRFANVRPALDEDDTFLFEVFCTLWERETALMPNPQLVQHFLRIQYITAERRFQVRYPQLERFVVLSDGEAAGRIYLHRTPAMLQIVELTLLPAYRSRGLATALIRDVMAKAHQTGQLVSIRAERRSELAAAICERLGFRMVVVDDQDRFFEWSPPSDRSKDSAGPVTEGPQDRGTLSSHSVP
ncbi:GNAT family N-acetyltransferase [Nocardioides mesophilus]|uniref:GNAT family N-acetyltransferase n=1 Tax=Nocardioides mesophilus TaxID=433659 RepID=A0A7G9RC20_9ACTN|nr:GNAT family N-acetyltransferase [Nocardioides mesophilus]QNN53145.1 GNAT family N-acetyltransferase [Nocardioides mesophilus]